MADEVMKIVSPIIQCSMAQQLWPKMSLDRFPKSKKSARLVTLGRKEGCCCHGHVTYKTGFHYLKWTHAQSGGLNR